MAISLKASGVYVTYTTATTGAMVMPGTPAAGDRVYAWLMWKNQGVTVNSVPAGWNLVGTFKDGSVASGNGVGSMTIAVYYRDYQAGDANPTFGFSASVGIGCACLQTWSKGAGEVWGNPYFRSAAWTAGAATQTVNASASSYIPNGSVVMAALAISDDTATFTRNATSGLATLGGTAPTWAGNVVESPAAHFSTATGNDMAADLVHRFITTGSPSTTLTQGATLAAADTGAAVWVIQDLVTLTPIANLTDDFSTKDTSKWTWAATADVVGGQLEVTAAVPIAGITSTSHYNLVGGEIIVHLPDFFLDGSNGMQEFRVQAANTWWWVSTARMSATGQVWFREATSSGGATDTTQVVTTDPWWRIRESAGTVYWDTSVDGVNWTNRKTKAAPVGNYQQSYVILQGGINGSATGTEGTAHFDNVNIPPAAGDNHVANATDAVGIADALVNELGRTRNDPVGITDAISPVQDFVRSYTDSLGVTDTLTAAQAFIRAFTDPVGISDSFQTAVFTSHVVNQTDAVGLLDSFVTAQAFNRVVTDSVGVTDALSLSFTKSATDPVGITDSATFGQAFAESATDPVGVTDAITLALGRLATDTLAITDSLATQADWVRTQTDPVNITDSLSLANTKQSTDPVGIADSIATAVDFVRTFTDAVGVSDSLSFTLGRFFTDAVNIADSVNIGRTQETADSAGILDAFIARMDYVRSITDALGISDEATFVLQVPGVIAGIDLVGVSDSATFTVDYVRNPADTVGIADSLVKGFGPTRTDPLGLTDEAQWVANYVRVPVDSVGITDSASFSSAALIDDSDQLGITDSLTAATDSVRAWVDSLGLSDDSQWIVDYVRAVNDLVGLEDSVEFEQSAQRVSIDSIDITDDALFVRREAQDFILDFTDELIITDDGIWPVRGELHPRPRNSNEISLGSRDAMVLLGRRGRRIVLGRENRESIIKR